MLERGCLPIWGSVLRLPGSGDLGLPQDRKEQHPVDLLLQEDDAVEKATDLDVSGASCVSSTVVVKH
jgi:hypothetical protein